MIETYLKQLEEALERLTANKFDIKDILMDYKEMYAEAKSRGKTDTEIESMLGTPEEVADSLKETLEQKAFSRQKTNKLVALSPFIATFCFFIAGFYFDLWYVAWLFFLLIPIIAIIGNTPRKGTLVALSPFVALIILMITGFYLDAWVWGWMAFLLIPILGMFSSPNKKKAWLFLGLMALSIVIYVYMISVLKLYNWAWLSFTPVVAFGLFHMNIEFHNSTKEDLPSRYAMLAMTVLSVAIFLVLGLTVSDGWVWSWQCLLLIPVSGVLIFARPFKFVMIAPFIAVVLFFSLGYFFQLFYISWIAFLLIPVAGILSSK